MGANWQQIKLLRKIAGGQDPEPPRRLDIPMKIYYVECSLCGYNGGWPPFWLGEAALNSYECFYCKKAAWIITGVKKK